MALPKKITDYFNLPAYDPNMFGPTFAKATATRTLPNQGGTYQTPVVSPQSNPAIPPTPPPYPPLTPSQVSQGYSTDRRDGRILDAPLFAGGGSQNQVGSFGGTAALPQKYLFNNGAVTPAQTGSYTPPTSSGLPPTFINPKTGAPYSVQEFVDNVATRMGGDVPTFAGNQFTEGSQTKEQLYATAGGLSASKGDIATGTTDPYKVATKSGINYSPSELAAIEKAYAGIYDPALNTALAKLDTKKKEEADALASKQRLAEMAQQHIYNMEEKTATGSEGPTSYKEWSLAGGKEGTGKTYAEYLSGASTGSSFKSEIAATGRQAVATMLDIGTKNPGIFGRTASMWMPTSARSDAFRNYQAQLDSLKGNIIPAALTAMREASKTGGALGQVSDREGAWLGASLGALEMSQSPEQVIAQLKQIDAHLKTWEDAVNAYSNTSSITADEKAYLKSQGVSDEEIAKLK